MTQSESSESAGIRSSTSGVAVRAGSHFDLTGDLSGVVTALHEQFDDQLDAEVVDAEIQVVADRFVDARIRSFVPLFVRRYASEKLRRLAGGGRPAVAEAPV